MPTKKKPVKKAPAKKKPVTSAADKQLEKRVISHETKPWLVSRTRTAGVPVTLHSAMSVPTIYRAVDAVSSTVATLPLPVYERDDQGGGTKAYDHPVYRLLNKEPNPTQTAAMFRKLLVVDYLTHGEAIAHIERRAGLPVALWRLDPATTRVELKDTTDGPRLAYYLSDGTAYWQDDVVHVVGLSLDGVRGVSPFDQCGESVSLALALDKFAANYMRNGAKPSGILEPPVGYGVEGHDDAEQAFSIYEGVCNAGKTMIPPTAGWKWQPISSNPQESQMHESRIHQMRDMQRVCGVQPPLVFDNERQTYANIQYNRMDYVQNTIRPIVIPFEQELHRKLLTPEEQDRFYVEHVVEGLLRGSFSEQVDALSKAVGGPFFTANEARKILGLPAHADGDQLTKQGEPNGSEPVVRA